MRLIDADALCRHLSDWQFGEMADGKHDVEYEVINQVIDGIEKEPTVDAVSVVRCRDCKWSYDAIGGTFCSHGVCVDCVVYDDWFCPMGERRSE